MLMMVGFYLLITDKNLTTVGVCLDQVYMYQLSFVGLNALVVFECFYLYHALLLKHQIIPDTAVGSPSKEAASRSINVALIV